MKSPTAQKPHVSKDYWGTRAARVTSGLLEGLARSIKQHGRWNKIFSTIWSLRLRNEMFIAEVLERHCAKTVLDLACGPGQDVIGCLDYSIGVDLAGSPSEAALARGYKDYLFYGDDLCFEVNRQVDAIVCMNLNAHVPFDLFSRILRNGLRYLKPGGIVVLVNEYDNDGFSYRTMKRLGRSRWEAMVSRMDHGHLEYETDFMRKLRSIGLGREVERRVLTASVLPFAHYLWFLGFFGTSKLRRALALAMDIPLSLLNVALVRSTRPDRAFLVGHVFIPVDRRHALEI